MLHCIIAVAIGCVVSGILGYALRGKEHAALQSAGSEVSKIAGDIKSKLP